jgi:hypothetical protein
VGGWAARQLDREMLKAEVRPVMAEEIRLHVDKEMRTLFSNLRVRIPKQT